MKKYFYTLIMAPFFIHVAFEKVYFKSIPHLALA